MRRAIDSAAPTPIEDAYRVLRDRLVHPTPAVPQALGFDVVATEFALERAAIETIFARLADDGLGLLAGDAGLIAWTPERRELADAYAIRATLDETAARRAAELIEAPDIRRLQIVMRSMATGVTGRDPGEIIRADKVFHRLVYQAAANMFMIGTIQRLEHFVRRYSADSLSSAERRRTVLDEQSEILSALERHDSQAAGRWSRLHVRSARRAALQRALDGEAILTGGT